MEEAKKVIINDKNVNSVAYNKEKEELMVFFKGGSKISYKPFSLDMFEAIITNVTARCVLEELRHHNVVGVRL